MEPPNEGPALTPRQQAIADYLTREGVAFDSEHVAALTDFEEEFSRGRMDWSASIRTPWGEFQFSSRGVLIGYSIGYYGAPEPRAGDPGLTPEQTAQGWLSHHRPDLVELIERGAMTRSTDASPNRVRMAFVRRATQDEASVFPHEFTIYVGVACHCVTGFIGDDREHATRRPPAMDEAAARAHIAERYARVAVDRIRLGEVAVGPYRYRTAYIAELTVAVQGVHDRHPSVFWIFDAATGETLERIGDPTEPDIRLALPPEASSPP